MQQKQCQNRHHAVHKGNVCVGSGNGSNVSYKQCCNQIKGLKLASVLENMPEMPFTAYYVVKHYVQAGKDTDALYAGIAGESGVVFIEMKEF